jgi:hypothetical protein
LTGKTDGKSINPGKFFKSMALPSITGRAAAGPRFPSPNTALPSVTIATVFCLIVKWCTCSGSCAIAVQIRPTPAYKPLLDPPKSWAEFYSECLFCRRDAN